MSQMLKINSYADNHGGLKPKTEPVIQLLTTVNGQVRDITFDAKHAMQIAAAILDGAHAITHGNSYEHHTVVIL
jgi:hypothetical protein